MIKTINFETLQRFDLKDAMDLQGGVIEKYDELIKAMNPELNDTVNTGYPFAPVTMQGLSNGILTFNPMLVITGNGDFIGYNSDDVAAGLTQIDISAIYNQWLGLANTWADPANPTEAELARDPGIYIYAYEAYSNTDSETRDFWSVLDGTAIQRVISTRRSASLNFFASLDQSYNVADANGNYPIRIGYIPSEYISLTNSSSPWTGSRWRSYLVWDQMFDPGGVYSGDNSNPNSAELTDTVTKDLNDTSSLGNGWGSNGSGFGRTFLKIQRWMDRIVQNGTSDPTGTEIIGSGETMVPPKYSLQGLDKRIAEQTENGNVLLGGCFLRPVYNSTYNNNLTTSDYTLNEMVTAELNILDVTQPFIVSSTFGPQEFMTVGQVCQALAAPEATDYGYDTNTIKDKIGIPVAFPSGYSVNNVTSVMIEFIDTVTLQDGWYTDYNAGKGTYIHLSKWFCGSVSSTTSGMTIASLYGSYDIDRDLAILCSGISDPARSKFKSKFYADFLDDDGNWIAPQFRIKVSLFGKLN